MTISVLLSGAGGAGTIEMIRTLHEIGRYRLVAIDASPYARGLEMADVGYVVPLARDTAFKDALAAIFEREKPDFVVPLVDEEIPVFHHLAQEYAVTVVAPTLAFCEIALDKWRTVNALRQAEIPVPQTWLASDSSDARFPAIIKPRDGRGSRGLAYLAGPDDLAAYLARAPRRADCYVVQEQITGWEYTVSVVVGVGGPTLAVVPKKVIVKRGITQVGVTRVVPEIDRLCRQIQDRLRADGPFNVQLIMSQDRTPYVIEINPRYSTTVALTIAAGINEVDVVIRHALGEPIGALTFQPNLLMIRYHTQIYMPEVDWPPEDVIRCLEPGMIELSESGR